MTKDVHNILYIGPYNEESNRGAYAINNIKALISLGHNIKTIPIYCYDKQLDTPLDILDLETKSIANYDICIQHCDVLEYSFHKSFKQNIGIYSPSTITPHPIINSRLGLLDKIIVNSPLVLDALTKVVSENILRKIVYCPYVINIQNILTHNKEELTWIDPTRYYFYTELEFSDSYDWEKIIYVYLTRFIHHKAGLIIKTKDLDDEYKVETLRKKIDAMAIEANVEPKPENMPRILNGRFSLSDSLKVFNSINCFIESNKTLEYNYNVLLAAILNKDIIANENLPTAHLFDNTYNVKGHICNISHNYYNDIIESSMYNYYSSMDTNSLSNKMLEAYNNRYNQSNKYDNRLSDYDSSNIQNILC